MCERIKSSIHHARFVNNMSSTNLTSRKHNFRQIKGSLQWLNSLCLNSSTNIKMSSIYICKKIKLCNVFSHYPIIMNLPT